MRQVIACTHNLRDRDIVRLQRASFRGQLAERRVPVLAGRTKVALAAVPSLLAFTHVTCAVDALVRAAGAVTMAIARCRQICTVGNLLLHTGVELDNAVYALLKLTLRRGEDPQIRPQLVARRGARAVVNVLTEPPVDAFDGRIAPGGLTRCVARRRRRT